MKNKCYSLLIIIVLIITLYSVGCGRKEYTKEEVYEDFQNQISKIESYTCNAKVEAIGNKENTTYIFKHTYKKPDYYKLEVKSPKNLQGKTIEYKGDKVLVKNPSINDTIELPNINNDSHYLFIGDFIKNYMQNESIILEVTKNELKIQTEIPGDNKYFKKQILYVDNKTKNPNKMEILDNENKPIFIVTYEDFKYEK
ncbi:MAG: germination lipoprotein GerS [Terrisporobacter othiniensis]|nr:germination lipoprotein GerS [Terrisporobacter othiniensis]MDU6994913.1 germination lipoprotein GerS [Terrisporobacter othiniensis]SFJ55181.1 Outer membrane lipoprotein-sorting protein [Terrisporobacter glycolicus]